MTGHEERQFAEHRIEQLRRAAEWPLSKRLEWLFHTLAVVRQIQSSAPVSPPPWAKGSREG